MERPHLRPRDEPDESDDDDEDRPLTAADSNSYSEWERQQFIELVHFPPETFEPDAWTGFLVDRWVSFFRVNEYDKARRLLGLSPALATARLRFENGYTFLHTTGLHLAADACQKDLVDRLLQNGADPNIQDSEECAPLELATRHAVSTNPTMYPPVDKFDQIKVVQLLLDAGANPTTFWSGRTMSPLMVIVLALCSESLGSNKEHAEVLTTLIKLYIRAGADPKHRDPDSIHSPLEMAERHYWYFSNPDYTPSSVRMPWVGEALRFMENRP